MTTARWLQHLKAVGKDMEYPCHIWQFNSNDRVIRQGALEATRRYIRNNPQKNQF